jgi:hypothetical protein
VKHRLAISRQVSRETDLEQQRVSRETSPVTGRHVSRETKQSRQPGGTHIIRYR